jgi:Zn-dependent M28 family amino/carboxypeptidase
MKVLAALVACGALAIAACGDDGADARTPEDLFDADRAMADVQAQVDLGPRPAGSAANAKQAKLIARRLRQAGVEDVRVQRPHLNVVGTIPGRSKGSVVVGAHHDTYDIPDFVGANDGASGVAVVLELARSLPAKVDGPDLRLALFDAEEARPGRDFSVDGTRGSRQYVRYAKRGSRRQGSPPLRSIEAMVLFDLVGDCDLQLPREQSSDQDLYAAFADASEETDGDAEPFEGTTAPVDDDHVPFLEAGIPAVDLIDFTFGSGGTPGAYWHTPQDTVDKVCAESLDAVGEAAARAVPELG